MLAILHMNHSLISLSDLSQCVIKPLQDSQAFLVICSSFFIIFPGLKQLKLIRFLAVHAASDNKVAEIRSRIGEAKAPGMFGRFETIGCHVCHVSFKLNNQQKPMCFCLTKKT